jgi:hypothetical protein
LQSRNTADWQSKTTHTLLDGGGIHRNCCIADLVTPHLLKSFHRLIVYPHRLSASEDNKIAREMLSIPIICRAPTRCGSPQYAMTNDLGATA